MSEMGEWVSLKSVIGFIIKAGYPSFNVKMSDLINAPKIAAGLIKYNYRMRGNFPLGNIR